MSIILSANGIFQSFEVGVADTKVFDFNVHKSFWNLFNVPKIYVFSIRSETPVSLSIYNAAHRLLGTTQTTLTSKLPAGRYTVEVHMVDRTKSGNFEIGAAKA